MSKLFNILLIFLLSLTPNCISKSIINKPIKIVVIDSGFNEDPLNPLKLCNKGIDLTFTDMNDSLGHGTNVSYIIANKLLNLDYCIYPIKIYSNTNSTSLTIFSKSFEIALSLNPDIVNISSSGIFSSENEKLAIKALLDKNIKVVVAAGNNNTDLDTNCNEYPACYDSRIIVVGNLDKNGKKHYLSNYGKYVKRWEIGTNVKAGGYFMTGTSMSAAIATSKIAYEMLKP